MKIELQVKITVRSKIMGGRINKFEHDLVNSSLGSNVLWLICCY